MYRSWDLKMYTPIRKVSVYTYVQALFAYMYMYVSYKKSILFPGSVATIYFLNEQGSIFH